MDTPVNSFTTTSGAEFSWPHSSFSKISTPRPPPKNSDRRLYLPKMDPDDCRCDVHKIGNPLTRYKELTKKEADLCKDIKHVNQELTTLMCDMLENPDMSEMKSGYRAAYDGNTEVRNFKYRTLMAAADSPIKSPINSAVSQLQSGYRDPIRFRYSSVGVPVIEPAEHTDLSRDPKSLHAWSQLYTGRSEYMDTFCKLGLSNLKNQQQYLEPLPSSRRQWGDCKI
ncbi:uncharacterized protein LOC135169951 [Diachasmimorpha longicaudata]|uniref:uncharacterized protein LOC135169951 n=1 Tax=Diachasmimorpha longicaudata TaxID=58733 RepID=UPI0030B8BD29